MSISKLRQDIETLALVLLPSVAASDLPSYEDALKTRAFLVLAHSAIEEILEEEIYNAVKNALAEEGDRPARISVPLAAKYADIVIGQNAGKVPSPHVITRMLAGIYYNSAVKPNNGIRQKAISGLCKPLGLDISELGPDADEAISALETLGAKRGNAAHTFSFAAQESPHPLQVREWVDAGVSALETLLPMLLSALGVEALGTSVTA